MNSLSLIRNNQAIWSQTANKIKRKYNISQKYVFFFTIFGAFFAMLASQMTEGRPRLAAALISTSLFSLVTLITARFLGDGRSLAWVRSRAVAEALKAEAYKYLASAEPYDVIGTQDRILNERREQIEKKHEDLLNQVVCTAAESSIPPEKLSPQEYIDIRINKQITNFFETRAINTQFNAKILRTCEISLSFTTALITAFVGVIGKDPAGWGFDFIALASVLTTISGIIVAHIEAQRFDLTAAHYRATARRLRNAVAAIENEIAAPSKEWSGFVTNCEQILAEENKSWAAEWGKQSA